MPIFWDAGKRWTFLVSYFLFQECQRCSRLIWKSGPGEEEGRGKEVWIVWMESNKLILPLFSYHGWTKLLHVYSLFLGAAFLRSVLNIDWYFAESCKIVPIKLLIHPWSLVYDIRQWTSPFRLRRSNYSPV